MIVCVFMIGLQIVQSRKEKVELEQDESWRIKVSLSMEDLVVIIRSL